MPVTLPYRMPCRSCARPMVSAGTARIPEGGARHFSRGLCISCYQRIRRIDGRRGIARYAPISADTAFHRSGQESVAAGTVLPAATGADPATAHAAALTVCERARDTTDARHLMAVLGLL